MDLPRIYFFSHDGSYLIPMYNQVIRQKVLFHLTKFIEINSLLDRVTMVCLLYLVPYSASLIDTVVIQD